MAMSILDKNINGTKTDFTSHFLSMQAMKCVKILHNCVERNEKGGVEDNVQKQEWTVYLENIGSSKIDASIGSWVNDPTPSDPYQLWHSSQTKNKGSNLCGVHQCTC